MSRVKTDLSHVSINQLSVLTGKHFRLLKKLLADLEPIEEGGTLNYVPSEALPIIYGVADPEDGQGEEVEGRPLDPVRERARLDRLKADKVNLEIEIMRKKVIPIERVEAAWSKVLGAFRARILNLPSKLAPKICAVKETKEIERILRRECNEALEELSKYDGGLDART